MRSAYFSGPAMAIEASKISLRNYGEEVDPGHWQGIDTTGHSEMVTKEILDLRWHCQMPETESLTAIACDPNLPWAEIEFQERVGRESHNPHQSLPAWPWWKGQWDATTSQQKFTHTYSERFWPNDIFGERGRDGLELMEGIRYRYGDLDDVIALLRRQPTTRQATFPIFFPEDTGAAHGGRIPCTLHYHFMMRNNRLHLWYPLRSCDAVRHFADDVYMAIRLVQWVLDELRMTNTTEEEINESWQPEYEIWKDVTPGHLYFSAYSFHVHKADEGLL